MSYLSEASPLETYNSLSDRHLVNFFRSARIRRHLIKSGLVTEDGEILPESEYRELHSRENQKRALLELIAQAIVERSLEEERMRQGKIRKTLEEICKLHRVRRMREERQKRAEETILMQLVPRTPRSREKLDPIATSSSGKSMDRQSQMEVAKLRRIHRKHQLRDRKAGKPPYLYLYEPGVARGQPKNSGRLRTQQEKATLAKSRGDTHQLARESTNLDVARSSEGDQSCSHDREDQGDRTMGEERSSRSLGSRETIKDAHLRTTMGQTEESEQRLVLTEESEKSRQNDVSYREPHRKDNTNARKHTLFPRSPPMPDKTVPGAVPTMVFSASKPPHGVFIPASSEARNRVQSQNITSPRKLRPVRSRPHSSRTAGDLDMYQIAGQHRPECNISGESEGLPKLISSRSDEKMEEIRSSEDLPSIMDKAELAKTPCVVRFMYLGATRLEEAAIGRTSEPGSRAARGQTVDWAQRTKRLITVNQQPSGTNTITVFKGVLQPGDVFEFTSRRVFGHPFSLSLCIDGTQDARISACCEYRHKCGMRIGGKYGHFVYLSVEGSVPCFKCQAAQSVRLEGEKLKKESRPFDLLTESGAAYAADFEEMQSSGDDTHKCSNLRKTGVPSDNSRHSSGTKSTESANESDWSKKGT